MQPAKHQEILAAVERGIARRMAALIGPLVRDTETDLLICVRLAMTADRRSYSYKAALDRIKGS